MEMALRDWEKKLNADADKKGEEKSWCKVLSSVTTLRLPVALEFNRPGKPRQEVCGSQSRMWNL